MTERILDGPPLDPTAAPDRAAGAETVLYGVGDIHGMRAELDRLLELIDADAPNRAQTVVFLGDYVNRGPAGRQVLERLIAGPRRADQRWIFLRGNHDQMFLDALAGKSERAFAEFLKKGGAETLASYGLRRKDASPARARRAVPPEHRRFLENLGYRHAEGGYVFVHAGLDPDLPLDAQSAKTMLSIREPFLRKAHRLRFTVVHGHSPNPNGPIVAPGRIGVDTAAHASGVLTAVALSPNSAPRFLSTPRR